jgi:phospholipid/cholesterol/gamma-HCH transport system permease protein
MNTLQTLEDGPARLWRLAQRRALGWARIVYLGAVVLVLLLSPSTYRGAARTRLAHHMVRATLPVLPGFTALAALVSLSITRIVVVTAQSYGLSRYALEMVVRVLVLELIPLTAALFVALRCSIPQGLELARLRAAGHLDRLRRQGADPVRMELLPALSCVVALAMAYLGVYGSSLAGLPGYTRMFGQVFTPAFTLVFVLKTLFSSLAVALIPTASALHPGPGMTELGGLARMFALLLLIELISLMGNYYG